MALGVATALAAAEVAAQTDAAGVTTPTVSASAAVTTAPASPPATNDADVIKQFAQATLLPAPQVTTTAAGAEITWNNTLDLGVYQNKSAGGTVLTPNVGGALNKTLFGTDYKRVAPGDETTWAQADFTRSNDTAVQKHPFLVNKVQVGYSLPGVSAVVGDIALAHSALGAQIPLRGAQGQKTWGPVVFSGAAGLFADDWRTTLSSNFRQSYPREAYAFRVGSAPDAFAEAIKGFEVFATVQRFSDLAKISALVLTPPPTAKGMSATVGAAYRRDVWVATLEWGQSRFEQVTQTPQSDRALLFDIGWQGDPVSVRTGYHDIGSAYTTLGTVSAGTRETYANLGWKINAQLTAGLDARVSRYTPNVSPALTSPLPVVIAPQALIVDPFAPLTPIIALPPKVVTDSKSANATLSYNPAWLTGFSNNLSLGRATTQQLSSTDHTKNDNVSATTAYTVDGWTGSVNVTATKNDAIGANPSIAKTRGGTLTLGRSINDAPSGRGVNWSLGYTKQWQDNGATASAPAAAGWNNRLNGTFGVSWQDKGSINLAAFLGHLKDPVSGAIGKQQGWQSDATWQFAKKWSFKLYIRDSKNWQALMPQAYTDRSIGASLVGTF